VPGNYDAFFAERESCCRCEWPAEGARLTGFVTRVRSMPLVITAAVVIACTAAIVPVMRTQLGPSISFMPALITAVAIFDVMSVYLLLGEFRDRGDRRSLAMASAYVWSLTVMAAYALAFPGAVSSDPPLALTASFAPYLYVTWHCGFPVLLGLAWAPWPARLTKPVDPARRVLIAAWCVVATVAFGVALVASYCLLLAGRMPALIDGVDTSRMTPVGAPATLPLVILALLAATYGTRARSGPERWTSIAVLACACDLVLTYAAQTRFSLGWYAGRSLTLLAAGIVLFAMFAEFRKVKRQAERDALLDALTHLVNRRGASDQLERMMARARQGGAPMSVLCLDLDWFKSINDTYGHAIGDAVLVEVGRVLNATTRVGDVAARLGGEEFLVILHDTDSDNALEAGERFREKIAQLAVPGVLRPITASVGVATLHGQDLSASDLLCRADSALYAAKSDGRNCVRSDHLVAAVAS